MIRWREKLNLLTKLAGEPLTTGQSKRIIAILLEKYGIESFKRDAKGAPILVGGVPKYSVDKDQLVDLVALIKEQNINNGAKEFVELIIELRTLQKSYSTYLKGIYNRVLFSGGDKAYTTFNQVGTVTGRVSSDAQQYPRGPVTTIIEGEEVELYHPRKSVITPKGYFTVYIDYASMESRGQAILSNWIQPNGDPNLLKAFIPYGHYSRETGIKYDMVKDVSRWGLKDYWVNNEEKTFWEPTDIHAATTISAIGKEKWNSLDAKEQKKLRNSLGKSTNFLEQYNGGLNALRKHPVLKTHPDELLKALHNGYNKTFPSKQIISKWINDEYLIYNYVISLTGRKYYIGDEGNRGLLYKFNNYLVQGFTADLLKEKEVETYKFLKENGYKTELALNVHDELQFIVPDNERHVVPHLLKIMNTFPWTTIPILADVEISNTNWADKKAVIDLDKWVELGGYEGTE